MAHYAEVKSVEVLQRSKIDTPWLPASDAASLHVAYHLGELRELERPVQNRGADGRGQRFSTHRWTSRLGLMRSRRVSQLSLETEPEWRLYEDLRALGIRFRLEPGRARVVDPNNPAGRTWFVTQKGDRVRYAGASGFLVKRFGGKQDRVAREA